MSLRSPFWSRPPTWYISTPARVTLSYLAQWLSSEVLSRMWASFAREAVPRERSTASVTCMPVATSGPSTGWMNEIVWSPTVQPAGAFSVIEGIFTSGPVAGATVVEASGEVVAVAGLEDGLDDELGEGRGDALGSPLQPPAVTASSTHQVAAAASWAARTGHLPPEVGHQPFGRGTRLSAHLGLA